VLSTLLAFPNYRSTVKIKSRTTSRDPVESAANSISSHIVFDATHDKSSLHVRSLDNRQ
jgi:hypothetical protein